MKFKIGILILFFLPVFVNAQFASTEKITDYEFTLVKKTEVAGRQGVCADENYYYVSGSKELFKYSREGELVCKNQNPFEGINTELNHFGDIDFYDGHIYSGLEYFKDGVGLNISLGIYKADDLSVEKIIPVDSLSGQKEVSGIAIDAKNGTFWLSDWTDGSCLYKYNLETGKYIGKIILTPKVIYQQGVLSIENYLLVTSDDGDAEKNESDNLYAVEKTKDTGKKTKPVFVKKFSDVLKEGEIEGLTYDKYADELLVLFNRGARIIKGMPKGFYPGYEKEIHEIYHYKIHQKNK